MRLQLQKRVQTYMERHAMLSDGGTVICAVSGGADSLCLLRLLSDLRGNSRVHAVHVHHGIRGEAADSDAAYVQKLCDAWGVPVAVRYVDALALAEKEHIGLEEAARKLRYQALFEEVKMLRDKREDRGAKHPSDTDADRQDTSEGIAYGSGIVIAVAHNRDDNAETLLMHLCRGAGLGGLAGIAPVKDFVREPCVVEEATFMQASDLKKAPANGFRIIRPLLDTSRAEIEEYLREQDIAWCTDETNADTAYTRNAVRQELLPYLSKHINTQAARHLAEAAEHLREVSDYLERQIEDAYAVCMTRDGALSLPRLRAQEGLIQAGVLKKTCAGGAFLERHHLESLQKLIASDHGTVTLDLPEGIRAERRYDKLFFHNQTEDGEAVLKKSTTKETDVCLPEFVIQEICGGSIPLPTGDNPRVSFLEEGTKLSLFLIEQCCNEKGSLKAQNQAQASPGADAKSSTCEETAYIDPLVFEVKDAFLPSYTNRLDYDKINEVLCAEQEGLSFRKRAAGDRLLIAEGKHKTLKKYMVDDKLPACARDALFILAAGSRVLWVPGFYTEPGLMARKDSERVLECRYLRAVP